MTPTNTTNTQNEKRVYPSELNSRAIACRVPINDYVRFLQEAISMNIKLNDWLLLKIYSNPAVGEKISGIPETDPAADTVVIIKKEELYDFLNVYQYPDGAKSVMTDLIEHWSSFCHSKSWIEDGQYFALDKDDIIAILHQGYMWHRVMQKSLQSKKANLVDVKNQLTILIQNKFHNRDEAGRYRRELFDLLKELN
jgi:hypothetical protein